MVLALTLLVVAKVAHRLPDQHDDTRERHQHENRASPRSRSGINGNRKGKKFGHGGRLLAIQKSREVIVVEPRHRQHLSGPFRGFNECAQELDDCF